MTLRRVLPVLALSSLIAACGGEPPSGPEPSTLTTLSISPERDSARSIGEDVQFSATARDQNGRSMSDVSLSWGVANDELAGISSDGLATSRANGTTEVIVSAKGVADTALLVIAQEVATIAVSPDVVELDAAGDTATFTADARDANDVTVAEPEIEWSVSDPAIATIDADGLVTAKGEGQIRVTATAASEVAGEATLRVGDVAAPIIESVSPSPLREGETATLTGQNFSVDEFENRVMIGGVEANLLQGTTTRVDITVPSFNCLPAREVEVEISTSAGSDRSTAALEPDEPPITLATGEQQIEVGPSQFCLQFPATTASERYVVGVQSLSDLVGSLTTVMLTSEAADGNAAALASSVSLDAEMPVSGGGQEIRTPEWIESHRRAEQRLRDWERRNLRPQKSLPAQLSGGPQILRSVSGSAQVGDTVAMRVPDPAGTDFCSDYYEIGAEIRVIGTRAIVVADTANPDGGFTDADYQDMSDRIDADIFSTQVEYFGNPTDIDGNGRVVVVISKALNQSSTTFVGFVFGGDLYSRSSCASSDEGEIFYTKAPDPNGVYGSVYATEDARQQMPPLMAHELTHVIQMSRRFSDGNDFMSSIIAEGQATLSEEVVGHSVTGRQPGQNYGFMVAWNYDESDEFNWYRIAFDDLARYYGFESSTTRVEEAPDACGWWRRNPAPCISRSLWYGVSWSFLRWVSDQYGPGYPGGEQTLHQDLIGSGLNGPHNVESVVGVPLADLMGGWSAALYVDDRIAAPDPKLTFTSWDLVDIESYLYETAHLQPIEMGFTDWSGSRDVRASSAGYVALEGSGRPATAVRVRNSTDGFLPSFMQVWVVRLQ